MKDEEKKRISMEVIRFRVSKQSHPLVKIICLAVSLSDPDGLDEAEGLEELQHSIGRGVAGQVIHNQRNLNLQMEQEQEETKDKYLTERKEKCRSAKRNRKKGGIDESQMETNSCKGMQSNQTEPAKKDNQEAEKRYAPEIVEPTENERITKTGCKEVEREWQKRLIPEADVAEISERRKPHEMVI